MKITINGAPHEVAADTLSGVLDELGYGEARVATAVNETFVPANARAGQVLASGDRIEVIAPRQGG